MAGETNLAEQLTSAFRSMSSTQRVMVIAISMTVLLALAGLGIWAGQETKGVLASNISPTEASSIVAQLDKMQVPYELSGDQRSILVPESKVGALRLKFAGDGLLTGDKLGFEKLENAGLGTTDFSQKVIHRRAMEAQLAKTIMSLQQVTEATVHITPSNDSPFLTDKEDAKALLSEGVERLAELQEKLYANNKWSVLLVFQAMDAAGKDSVIKHVMSGINPQGVQVHSFKAPSEEELDHDFLWRIGKALPERGRIGIFNRSHYEEVLTVRVHGEYLARQRLPDAVASKKIWQHRFDDIRAFERHLARNGTLVLKFFLNVSLEEQRKRFLERIDQPGKRWKFSMGDVAERKLWPRYMDAYEKLIQETSRDEAPWYVVPADNKWFTRLVVAGAVAKAMEGLDLAYPKVEGQALKDLQSARKALEAEG